MFLDTCADKGNHIVNLVIESNAERRVIAPNLLKRFLMELIYQKHIHPLTTLD
jgi:hypothetical protein